MAHTPDDMPDDQLSIPDWTDQFGGEGADGRGDDDRPDETETEAEAETDDVHTANGRVCEFAAIATARDRARLADPIRAVLSAADDEVDGRSLGADQRSELSSEVIRGGLDGSQGIPVEHGSLAWSVLPDRDGVEHLIGFAAGWELPLVVVDSLVSLGDDVRSIRERLDTLLTAGVRVRVLGEDLDLDPDSESSEQVLNLLDGLVSIGPELARDTTVDDLRDRGVLVSDWSGRPPLGCEIDDGTLVPADDFDSVVDTLELAQARINSDSDDVGISRAEAARRIGCSPRTVNRCIDERAHIYGLEERGE